MENISKILIGLGILFIILGLLTYLFGGLFSWFGKLPGDIRVEGKNYFIYAPITSFLLISLIINIIFYVLSQWFK